MPPPDVVRHDGDDSYLVVAADKGTATFSDIANEVAASYGFWPGDAFGNGMLLSEHIRLIAAFDHRHIFLDPEPDAATSFAERQRMFDLPLPRPKYEIFVYSPRVEGVHLRFGSVARGGLRWSDRPEDFRTEILGLVKAQAVKNAVIVPVGAKGGFVLKQKPGDRDEAVDCYKLFITALLDVTDNIVGGDIKHPRDVVRHDGDDPYLVVAADKGTADLSDTATSAPSARWQK